MCGLVGIFDRRGQTPVDRVLLARMNDSLSHRGPDEHGLFIEPGIGLGHRRLSIIDLKSGQQPLFNEDHSVVVVYNGEIYNFKALYEELAAAGHRFRTHCDTEVIVHAWEEWGEACVERFRGMFVFALWDKNEETLFLARDRLGIKPLYYAELANGTVIFGSELKSLLLYPDLPTDIDVSAVEDYFAYGYVPDPKSIYRSVLKLSPGHVLKIRRGQGDCRPRVYWDLTFEDTRPMTVEEASEELIPRLRDAVEVRLISEVPLGSFLSGGVDSSAVVAMMAQGSDDPVNACSISFADPAYDESDYARAVAERYGANHHVQRVDPDAFDLVDTLASIYDEPFADSSAIPTYRVCKLARERVTVALSGDGGDELFAGYRRYRWHHYEELVRRALPNGVRRPLFGVLGALYPKLDWAPKPFRAKATLEALARDSVEGYFHSVSVLHDGLRSQLYSESMKRQLQGYRAQEVLRAHMEGAPADDHLSRVQYADFKTYLPGDILTKVDRASMANSLEVRVPILDHEFVEWAVTVPAALRLKGHDGKFVFKHAMRPYLPDDLIYRQKMGFAVPVASWFRGPLKDRLRAALSSPVLGDTGLFDMNFIGKLIDQHQSGARNHSAPLWALLMFESTLRTVHGAVVRRGAGEATAASQMG